MRFVESRKKAVRWLWACGLLLLAAGCAMQPVKHTTSPVTKKQPPPSPVAAAPVKVLLVNSEHRFVVLDFSSRLVPPLGTQITMQRDGKIVGSVRVTGPVRGSTIVADVLEGELKVGDEAR